MNLQKRIEILLRLRDYLSANTEDWQAVKQTASPQWLVYSRVHRFSSK